MPAGYLVAEPQSVKVEYAQTVEATFINEEKPEQPPQTGYNGNSTMVIVLLIGIAAIGAISLLAHRSKEN